MNCNKNGIKKEGESCTLNNNCIYPNCMNKMKNLHVLPTDKPSNLAYYQESTSYNKPILQLVNTTSSDYKYQHIFITNDEEIKHGDWYFFNYQIIKCENPDLTKIPSVTKNYCKKIILTTDQDLDGVQAIDNTFLEWFVKNPSCESIKAELGVIKHILWSGKLESKHDFEKGYPVTGYKIIIPKEETKQELDCPYDFTSRCTMGRCDCKPKQEKPCTQNVVDEAMRIVSKDVRQPKCVRDGLVKQETLEEVAEKYANELPEPYNYGINSDKKKGFIEGAKWQAERMYSEEEVLEILEHHTSYLQTFISQYIDRNDMKENDEWFEQFKKK